MPSAHSPTAHQTWLTSVVLYFALTFAVSWGGVVAAVGMGGFPGTTESFQNALPIVVAAMLAGPSLAGLVVTALYLGREGLRDMGRRLLKIRVGAEWYGLAFLLAPIVLAVVLMLLSIGSPVYLPGLVTTNSPISHLVTGIVTGAAAGLFEEIGWTGFAIPRLRRRFGVFATGLIVGIIWGAWHLLVVWWGSSGTAGLLPMAIYLPAMTFSFLPPYRVLMVWVYDRTGSLLIAMLMHASLTASVRIFDPVPISGMPIVVYNLVLGLAFWGVVAAVAIAIPKAFKGSRRARVVT
jgi:membrane protease YdiL (CAAX protease family)